MVKIPAGEVLRQAQVDPGLVAAYNPFARAVVIKRAPVFSAAGLAKRQANQSKFTGHASGDHTKGVALVVFKDGRPSKWIPAHAARVGESAGTLTVAKTAARMP